MNQPHQGSGEEDRLAADADLASEAGRRSAAERQADLDWLTGRDRQPGYVSPLEALTHRGSGATPGVAPDTEPDEHPLSDLFDDLLPYAEADPLAAQLSDAQFLGAVPSDTEWMADSEWLSGGSWHEVIDATDATTPADPSEATPLDHKNPEVEAAAAPPHRAARALPEGEPLPPSLEPLEVDYAHPDATGVGEVVGAPPAAASIAEVAAERTNHVARNSAVIAVGTFGSRILGFVRTALFALCVGSSLAADAFTISNTLPTQINLMISTGVITAVFIPQLTKAMKRSDGGADFINRLVTVTLLLMGAVTVLCTVGVPYILRLLVSSDVAANSPGYFHLVVLLGFWCMPQLFFYALFAVLAQILNARGRFVAVAWAPALANIIQIVGLIVFYVMWQFQGDPQAWTWQMVALLGGSTTLGIAAQGLCLIVPLIRDGFHFRMRFGWRGYGFGAISKMSIWTIGAVIAAQVGSLFNTWGATAVRNAIPDAPGNSAANYAYTLYILPYSLVVVSIITALFPVMSRAWEDRHFDSLRGLIRRGLEMPAVWVIPAGFGLAFLGLPIVRTVYAALSLGEAQDVWLILCCYCIGMLGYGVCALGQRFCFVIGEGSSNFWMSSIMPLAQIAGAFLAVAFAPARYGVAWMAIGTSVGSIASAIAFLWLIHRRVGNYGLGQTVRLWIRLSLAALVAGAVAFAVQIGGNQLVDAWIIQPVIVLVGVVLFVVVYWALAKLLHINEVTDVVASGAAAVKRLVKRALHRS